MKIDLKSFQYKCYYGNRSLGPNSKFVFYSYFDSDVNYRANIWALKQLGCTHILATTATGSLVEEYKPGDLVILDDFIDRYTLLLSRENS